MKVDFKICRPPYAQALKVSSLARFCIVRVEGAKFDVVVAYIPGRYLLRMDEAKVMFASCVRVMQRLLPEEAIHCLKLRQVRRFDVSSSLGINPASIYGAVDPLADSGIQVAEPGLSLH
jgi:hypothetical protein